ncbi:hypothetical protein HYC85_023778 [Camellia sinensis]|uniref:Uncharacterized protein n=1 Tax=Camellia sinensis TaxID=4442 RepID=A0A7J7GFH4_CAMSI|nr:hypothetical protein HYC85_023778 [Camellia sinensis]
MKLKVSKSQPFPNTHPKNQREKEREEQKFHQTLNLITKNYSKKKSGKFLITKKLV